ncbi:hypothetical protein J437_LFUL007264, partial [Ladona fulva]
IYESIVKPTTTYRREVWPLKEKSERTLRAVGLDFWRRAAGISPRKQSRRKAVGVVWTCPTNGKVEATERTPDVDSCWEKRKAQKEMD